MSHLWYPGAPHHRYVGGVAEDCGRAHGTVVADGPEIHFVHVEVEDWTNLTGGHEAHRTRKLEAVSQWNRLSVRSKEGKRGRTCLPSAGKNSAYRASPLATSDKSGTVGKHSDKEICVNLSKCGSSEGTEGANIKRYDCIDHK